MVAVLEMKSTKFIKWEKYFCLGHTYRKELPVKIEWAESIIELMNSPIIEYENITFDVAFNVAPCNIDKAIHKANRLCKYYTFKEYPGAVKFLGNKL